MLWRPGCRSFRAPRPADRFPDQSALTDAGIAADQHQPTGPASDTGDRRVRGGQRNVPSDQRLHNDRVSPLCQEPVPALRTGTDGSPVVCADSGDHTTEHGREEPDARPTRPIFDGPRSPELIAAAERAEIRRRIVSWRSWASPTTCAADLVATRLIFVAGTRRDHRSHCSIMRTPWTRPSRSDLGHRAAAGGGSRPLPGPDRSERYQVVHPGPGQQRTWRHHGSVVR